MEAAAILTKDYRASGANITVLNKFFHVAGYKYINVLMKQGAPVAAGSWIQLDWMIGGFFIRRDQFTMPLTQTEQFAQFIVRCDVVRISYLVYGDNGFAAIDVEALAI